MIICSNMCLYPQTAGLEYGLLTWLLSHHSSCDLRPQDAQGLPLPLFGFFMQEEGIRDIFEDTDQCQDAEVLRDFATLSSSQLSEIERLGNSSCEEEVEEDTESAQREADDDEIWRMLAAHNEESGSTTKRQRKDF